MKRVTLLFTSMLCVLMLLSFTACAEEEQYIDHEGLYKYCLMEDGNARLTEVLYVAEHLQLPETVDGHPVTALADTLFDNLGDGPKAITIPAFVTSIDDEVLRALEAIYASPENPVYTVVDGALIDKLQHRLIRYPSLSPRTSCTIPDGITSIDDFAFSGSALESITIPNTVTDIGKNPFELCYRLKELVIAPDHPTLLLKDRCLIRKEDQQLIAYLFPVDEQGKKFWLRSNTAELEVVVPDGVRSIGNSAFYGNRQLLRVTLPDSVTDIGNYAFAYCEGLEDIHLSAALRTIGASAFRECEHLEHIVSPTTLSWIGDHAFSNCSGLKTFDGLGGVKEIDDYAFQGCVLFRTVTLPEGLTRLGSYAFHRCENLRTVSIPANLSSIGANPFRGADNLDELTIAEDHPYLLYTDHALYSKEDHRLVWASQRRVKGSFTVLEGTRVIDGYALYGLSQLTELQLPDSVEELRDHAVAYCKNIASLSLPAALRTIGPYAFSTCTALQEIRIPKGVTAIGKGAFCDCTSLEIAWVPDTVLTIGAAAFYGCIKLTDISIPEYLTEISDETFSGCRLLRDIDLPDSIVKIGEQAFYDCRSMDELYLPDGLLSIGREAFCDCSGLTQVYLPDSLVYMGEMAFRGCRLLSRVDLSKNLEVIPALAFFECYSLSAVWIPEGVRKIEGSAFADCPLLTATIPASVTEITGNPFDGYRLMAIYVSPDNPRFEVVDHALIDKVEKRLVSFPNGLKLERYRIPDGVEIIGVCAFSRTYNVDEVVIPNGVRIIEAGAFEFASIHTLHIPETVRVLGYEALANMELEGLYLPEQIQYIERDCLHNYVCGNNFVIYVRPGSAAEVYCQTEDWAYRYAPPMK